MQLVAAGEARGPHGFQGVFQGLLPASRPAAVIGHRQALEIKPFGIAAVGKAGIHQHPDLNALLAFERQHIGQLLG